MLFTSFPRFSISRSQEAKLLTDRAAGRGGPKYPTLFHSVMFVMKFKKSLKRHWRAPGSERILGFFKKRKKRRFQAFLLSLSACFPLGLLGLLGRFGSSRLETPKTCLKP
jgi:hypothetical protein